MELKNTLTEFRGKVNKELKIFFEEKNKQHRDSSEIIQISLKFLQDYILRGGKRLRPALLYFTYKVFTPSQNINDSKIIKLSIFEELIQAFLLIHDDIMDQDNMRRGGSSVHRLFENYAQKNNFRDISHFGTSFAILVGDLASIYVNEIIMNSDIKPKIQNEIISLLSKQMVQTIFGQARDIILSYKEKYNEDEIIQIQRLKTATYTFETPILIGALLAETPKKYFTILSEYAIPAGIAYQIKDDILGVFGNEKQTGKSTKSDIEEGKKTLLIYHALNNSTTKEQRFIHHTLGKKDLNTEDKNKINEIIKSTGSLHISQQKCNYFIKKAKQSLKKLPNQNNKGVIFLEEIANYIKTRKY